MMARSIKGSSQRPDTLMQDRTSSQLDESSLATRGRTIHRGQRRKANVFRFAPERTSDLGVNGGDRSTGNGKCFRGVALRVASSPFLFAPFSLGFALHGRGPPGSQAEFGGCV